MSFHDMFKSIAGQESADLTPEIVEVVQVSAEEAAEAIIDKQLAETEKTMVESAALVEKHDTAIDLLTERLDELEECVDGMEKMSNGTIAFNAGLFAHYHKTAVKHANSFGAKIEHQGVENFADVGMAQLNGFEALKDLKEVAKKGAEAGKKFLTDLLAQIIKAIDSFFSAHAAMSNKAESMLKAIDKKESKDGEISIYGLLKDNGSDDYMSKLTTAFGMATGGSADDPDTAGKIAEALKSGEAGTRSVKALSIEECKARLKEVSDYGKQLQTMKSKANALINNSWAAMAKVARDRSVSGPEKFDAAAQHTALRKSVAELLAGIRRAGDVLKGKLKAVQDSVQDKKEAKKED